ncbi:heat shock 70 kDa protein 12A-like [Clytia hemisphaerica]|uniref:Heat shock 70 kDa protein 12A n=1 Tax=Clytia hemisphaerica TaxID=252671 RepID=A0A7M5X6R9_9CNID
MTSDEIDDFTATYLLGSTRQLSSEDTQTLTDDRSGSPDFFNERTERTMSRESKESFDLGEAEREAHEFMNELHENESVTSERKHSTDRLQGDTFPSLNPTVQRNSSLHVIRENPRNQAVGLLKTSSLSRSVNDISTMNAYRPMGSITSSNHQNNRVSYHGDLSLSEREGPLFMSSQRDLRLSSSQMNENSLDEKNNLNALQDKYTQAIHDFKLLRSTLTENMERQLMRTEQIDALNNNSSHTSVKRGGSNEFDQNITASSANLQRIKKQFGAPQYRSQDNIYQQQQQTDVILRKKTSLDHYSSQERLFNKRFSEMNPDEKYFLQHQGHHLYNQQPSPRPYNNNYDYKTGPQQRPTTYHGLDSYPMSQEQQREYHSLLRDQAAKSNFERYLKGSFNSHQSIDPLNHLEDPGYGGSGSTSPREMDSSLTTDRMSSRSGSIISRNSQTSAFAASVDSGVRMSFVGQHNSLVVVAIDFGTTFSGYAFSFTRDANSIHMMRRWEGGDPGVSNQKTPTTLLLKPDGSFHSFGFGARDFYHDLDANDAKKWLYFDKFKMTLHGSEDLNSGVEIKAANGKAYPALKVFAHALRFFKQHVLEELSDQSTAKLSEEDITWVVTVPAIWRQPAKQFMRTAAYEAGIASLSHPDRLLIALEPEAASIFCRKLRIRDCVLEDDLKAKAGDDSLISEDFQGITQYVVVDCGGGTVDLTVHELDVSQGTLKELHKGTGGPAGATAVDREFEKLLKNIFEADFIERFKVKRPASWVDLMISFEAKKRTARPGNQSALNISLPFSFIDYHKKHRRMTVEAAVKKFKNPDIKWSSQGMLRFNSNIMAKLFDPVVNEIIGHIQHLLMKPSLKHVKHLFLVGGFAESPLLQSSIREALDGRVRVIIPNDVCLAILKGAVLFGLDPTVVRVRRSAYTYGVGVLNKFDTNKHDQSKRVIKDGVVWCKDIFDCFVRVDESVGLGDRVTRSYAPARSKQKSTVINIYCTENLDVLYTTDKGATKCGKLRIEMPDVNIEDIPVEKRGKPRELQATMIFGDTEIKVSAVDVLSGQAAKASIDFLNY